MLIRVRSLIAVSGLIIAGLGGTTAIPVWAASSPHGPASAHSAASRPAAGLGGRGHAAARAVSVRAAAARPQFPVHAAAIPPLGRNGKPAGSGLPVRPSRGVKRPPRPVPAPDGPNRVAGGPAAGHAVQVAPLAPPTTVGANFDGSFQPSSNCNGCSPPDPNAAVSSTEIVQAVNLRLQVFNKIGVPLCGVALNTFFGTGGKLSDPRIQWDNRNNRFSMVVIPVPAASSTPATIYLAASQTADPCGVWWVYKIAIAGPSFPPGATLDYPYLGQDSVSILSSTNNFAFGGAYVASTAYAFPKAAVYTGGSLSFGAYNVAMSTAPVTVAGDPMFSTTTTYWLAAVPGTGYELYAMPTSSGGPVTLQATISSPFTAPSRQVNQPGTSKTLDPSDGRIEWAPVQDGNAVWFTHGIDIAGYPSIRYGLIDTDTDTAFTSVAFHSATSDDFNPSLGVSDGDNGLHVWLNWAYTDTPGGVPVSDTVNGVLPGQGIPAEIGTDRTLVTGSSSSGSSRFGDYSSVAIDPSSGGLTAVSVQEYFNNSGQWVTRIASTSFF